MSQVYEFSFPTRILFGPGAIQRLPDEVNKLGGNRVQFVTDNGLVEVGLLDPIRELLESAGLSVFVFDGVSPNPVEQDVREGEAHFKANECDFVIGIGGGSSMDVAKTVRLKATHDLTLIEYTTEHEGWDKIGANLPPLITIPTTAGTGSEVGRGAVITMESANRKALVFSEHLLAGAVVCDPELTLGLPPNLTAWTGADALTHNVEAAISNVYHPLSESIAIQGARYVFQHLPQAVAESDDIEARQGMMMAAIMGGMAFQKELGAAHSLAHPLSVHHDLNHGLANAIMLPHVLRFNQSTSGEEMKHLVLSIGEDVTGMSIDEAAARFVARIERLLREIGIPAKLSEIGIQESDLDHLTEDAWDDACHQFNPRPCTAEDLRRLYEHAL